MEVLNDADALAAGIAATMGHMEKLIRVWYLGNGIGYGRYPRTEGVWEAGHSVVTLDPKERYCSCGGIGHLESVMGSRAMRLRFLDMEPEDVFAHAKQGDGRCVEFVNLWHRALAAATSTIANPPTTSLVSLYGPSVTRGWPVPRITLPASSFNLALPTRIFCERSLSRHARNFCSAFCPSSGLILL